MSNKTQLQQNNIDLQSILSTVDGLPTADSVKHGLYVWKKCNPKSIAESDYTTVDVTKGRMTEQVYLYCADSYTVDMDSKTFTLVNPTSINCMYYYTQQGNSSYSPVQLKGKYFFPNVDGTKATSGTELYYGSPTSINASVRTDGSDSGYYTTCNAKKLTVSDVSFIEFVIADNANAYPDGGIQDEYWYERVVDGIDLSALGCTKAVTEKITPSSRTQKIYHSLGITPKIVIVTTESTTVGQYDTQGFIVAPFSLKTAALERLLGGTYSNNAGASVIDNNIVEFLTSKYINVESYFTAGVEYIVTTIG